MRAAGGSCSDGDGSWSFPRNAPCCWGPPSSPSISTQTRARRPLACPPADLQDRAGCCRWNQPVGWLCSDPPPSSQGTLRRPPCGRGGLVAQTAMVHGRLPGERGPKWGPWVPVLAGAASFRKALRVDVVPAFLPGGGRVGVWGWRGCTHGRCRSCCCCCCRYVSTSCCGTSSISSRLSLTFIRISKFSRPRT